MLDWKTDVNWARTALVVANFNKHLAPSLRGNLRQLIDAAERARIPVSLVSTGRQPAEPGHTFDGTDLEPGLRAVGRETLIITGAMTETVLESILRDAFLLGFNCVVAFEGTTVVAPGWTATAPDPATRNHAWYATTPELVAALTNVTPTKPGLAEALAAC